MDFKRYSFIYQTYRFDRRRIRSIFQQPNNFKENVTNTLKKILTWLKLIWHLFCLEGKLIVFSLEKALVNLVSLLIPTIFTSLFFVSMTTNVYILELDECCKKSHLKVTSVTNWWLLKMCHLKHRLRIFLFHRKIMVHSRYSSFCIFNHPMIYPISDVTMSISTWDWMHFWISFKPQIMKSPNLVSW